MISIDASPLGIPQAHTIENRYFRTIAPFIIYDMKGKIQIDLPPRLAGPDEVASAWLRSLLLPGDGRNETPGGGEPTGAGGNARRWKDRILFPVSEYERCEDGKTGDLAGGKLQVRDNGCGASSPQLNAKS